MPLFIAEIKTETVHNPGDDGMSGPIISKTTRLVEAEDADDAVAKVKNKLERFIEFDIRVSVLYVEVHEVIR